MSEMIQNVRTASTLELYIAFTSEKYRQNFKISAGHCIVRADPTDTEMVPFLSIEVVSVPLMYSLRQYRHDYDR